MRIQTYGRVIGLTYTSYPRSLPWKIRSPRGNKGRPTEDVECNSLDNHITQATPTYLHSPLKESFDHTEDQESLNAITVRDSLCSL